MYHQTVKINIKNGENLEFDAYKVWNVLNQ